MDSDSDTDDDDDDDDDDDVGEEISHLRLVVAFKHHQYDDPPTRLWKMRSESMLPLINWTGMGPSPKRSETWNRSVYITNLCVVIYT